MSLMWTGTYRKKGEGREGHHEDDLTTEQKIKNLFDCLLFYHSNTTNVFSRYSTHMSKNTFYNFLILLL